MVCIAAFIILGIVGIFVAILSIFWPKIGKNYWKLFKKSWGCFSKKIRLQKCETGFKEDVKNTILSRVIIKHPKWLKPLSAILEILSFIIIVVFAWAVLTSIKSLLALWALGTCNVTKPAACTLGAEICSIDADEPSNFLESTGRWFTEWGEIFEAIPEKFKTYSADDYDFSYVELENNTAESPIAIDIFDPGCSVCLKSYQNQKSAGFFDDYAVRLVPYAIQTPSGEYKFKNSDLIVRYILSAETVTPHLGAKILGHLFTEKSEENASYQNLFNDDFDTEQATATIEAWLKQDGASKDEIKQIRALTHSDEIEAKIAKNREIVENTLKVKGIPTMIYDGKKHTGLFKL